MAYELKNFPVCLKIYCLHKHQNIFNLNEQMVYLLLEFIYWSFYIFLRIAWYSVHRLLLICYNILFVHIVYIWVGDFWSDYFKPSNETWDSQVMKALGLWSIWIVFGMIFRRIILQNNFGISSIKVTWIKF